MTDRQQPDALEIASIAESADLAGYPTAKKANAYYLCLLEDCAQMIRRLHAENETLRASHGQAPAGAGEPTEQQILEAAFAPAQPAVEASRFGSPELQAMIIARCVEKDQADSVQEDAARYRFLRDGEWRDTDLEPFIRLQLNTLWDAKIDAARAAQEGKSHE